MINIKKDDLLNELIQLHDNDNCDCEGFSEEYDTKMCRGFAYLQGNITEEDALEGLDFDE